MYTLEFLLLVNIWPLFKHVNSTKRLNFTYEALLLLKYSYFYSKFSYPHAAMLNYKNVFIEVNPVIQRINNLSGANHYNNLYYHVLDLHNFRNFITGVIQKLHKILICVERWLNNKLQSLNPALKHRVYNTFT